MLAANGQSWRFEESEERIWSRIPADAPADRDGAAAAVNESTTRYSPLSRRRQPSRSSQSARPRREARERQ